MSTQKPNTAVATLEAASLVVPTVKLDEMGVARTNKNGNVIGRQFSFAGNEYNSVTDIAKVLRQAHPDWSGKKAQQHARAIRKQGAAQSKIMAQALMMVSIDKGFLPDYARLNKKGDKLTMQFVQVSTGITASDVADMDANEVAALEAALAARKTAIAAPQGDQPPIDVAQEQGEQTPPADGAQQ